MGVKDAQSVIATGSQASWDNAVHYYALKKSGNEQIKKHTFGDFLKAKEAGEYEEYDIMKDPYMKKYTYARQ